MDSVSLLEKWLNNKRDELFPYYFTKLDFLKLYGTRCRTQDKEFKCEEAVDENECIIGKDLYCQYSDQKCSTIIDSICNYYDGSGNYIQEKWDQEQIEYLDNLYKTGAVFEYSKYLSNQMAKQSIETNAFQKIYSKFSIGYNQGNKECHSKIENLLMGSVSIMAKIHELRKPLYEKLSGKDYIISENNNINLLEFSMYLFEILRKKYPTYTFYDSYTDILTHDNTVDTQILNIIKEENICLDSKNQTISFDLTKLNKEDFELGKPENSMIYNLLLTGYNIAKNTVFFVGSLILNATKFLIMNYGQITLLFFTIVMIQQILGLFVDTGSLINAADSSIKMIGYAKTSFSGLSDFINNLKPLMPYFNVLFTYCRDILCILMPLISNVHLIHSRLGIFIGNYIAEFKYAGKIIPPNFFNQLKDVAFIEAILHVLKNDFLRCAKTVRAMGPDRILTYVDDEETNFKRWSLFITAQWESGSTQPLFHEFIDELRTNPLDNVIKLFSILTSIITGTCFKEGATGEINIIAKEGCSLFTALFIEGPFYQESAVASVASQVTAPMLDSLNSIGSYNFFERFLELSTINTLFFIAVAGGLFVGYASSSSRKTNMKAHEDGKKYAEKSLKTAGKKKINKRTFKRKYNKNKRSNKKIKTRNTMKKHLQRPTRKIN